MDNDVEVFYTSDVSLRSPWTTCCDKNLFMGTCVFAAALSDVHNPLSYLLSLSLSAAVLIVHSLIHSASLWESQDYQPTAE